MSDATKRKNATAPYPAWPTFRRFLGDLVAKGTTPSRIDHTVMVGKSGSAQSAIRKALQFLGLIDAQHAPTPELHRLLDAFDSDDWSSTLKTVTLSAYEPILVDLDVENGTAQQLAECFRSQGNVSGNTLTMAVRFFLGALDEAGVKRSPYFVAPPRPPTKKSVAANAVKEDEPAKPEQMSGSVTKAADKPATHPEPRQPVSPWPSQPFLLPTRDRPIVIQAPKDLSLAEWGIIDAFVRGMIELSGNKMPPPSADTKDGG